MRESIRVRGGISSVGVSIDRTALLIVPCSGGEGGHQASRKTALSENGASQWCSWWKAYCASP